MFCNVSNNVPYVLLKKKDAHALPYFAIRTELTPARLATLKKKTPLCETE
ncbi:MAG TPA: hypothetical protein VIX18_05055 [Nitrospirota bacterium]